MALQEVVKIATSGDTNRIAQYMQSQHLLRQHANCRTSGTPMVFNPRSIAGCKDGKTWWCTQCKTMISIRSKSFFEKSKLGLDKHLLLLYHWALDTPMSTTCQAVGISAKTIDYFNLIREVCSQKLCSTPVQLGGPGVVVQIDESLFTHKPKYHRGRPARSEQWVFRLVGPSYRPARGVMRLVPTRDAATLLPIIQQYVLLGSIIHSDEWRAYSSIQSRLGLQHSTVNHSVNFVAPNGTHTQNIESYWNKTKMKLKRMRGVRSEFLSSYIDEFMWKEQYGKTASDAIKNIILHISEQFKFH